jgi:type IV secretion system protein VirB10
MTMPETTDISQVQDKRPKIVGLLPRNAQALVLGGVALLMTLIILFSGHNAPRPAHPPPPTAAIAPPDQARIQDYRAVIDDQMRKLSAEEAELAQTKQSLHSHSTAMTQQARSGGYETVVSAAQREPVENGIAMDRLKREYQSLFASNIALTYRTLPAPESAPAPPSSPKAAAGPQAPGADQYRLFEGTFLETVLTNRLDSSFSGPVDCMVTTKVYSHDGEKLLIPQGTRVLGEVRKLQSFGEQRLAVAFHRMIMPDGFSVDLDQFKGLDQIGETGLRDQVNHRYAQIFGVSLAIGAFAGLSQRNTSYSTDEPASEAYQQGVTNSLSQSALHILDRYLNVLPTFTIREGYRVKVYLSQDLSLPAYDAHPVRNDL